MEHLYLHHLQNKAHLLVRPTRSSEDALLMMIGGGYQSLRNILQILLI
jgi:hypothetical protein